MERDYEKDNWSELENLLKQAGSEVGVTFNNSIKDFIGVTKRELKSIMSCTIKRLNLPAEKESLYLRKANYLIG